MSTSTKTNGKNLPKIPNRGGDKNSSTKNLLIIAYIILAAIVFGMLQDPYCM